MKKILFYANINVDDLSIGITKKVFSQIKALRKMNYIVYYTAYTNDGVGIFNNEDKQISFGKYTFKQKKIKMKFRRWDLLSLTNKFLKETEITFDYGYLRFHYFDKYYKEILKQLKLTKSNVIIEAHGYPYKNDKFSLYAPMFLVDSLYEPFVRKYIDLVAAISNVDNIWGCKTIQIDNAIDLQKVKLKEPKALNDDVIRLISVSNEMKYHGYPKLIKGLYEYYKNGGLKEIQLNFVGEFRTETKELVGKLGLNDKVIFHGKKYSEELNKLYNVADIGIGALSPRAGAEHGSSIKTKEYFAKGLPFINGWKEYAFDDNYPYVKRFPLDNEIIDMNEVLEFYDSIKDDEDLSENMRMFAEENYTWEGQFTKVFSEF